MFPAPKPQIKLIATMYDPHILLYITIQNIIMAQKI